MSERPVSLPIPRPAVADPALTRPNWTTGVPRNPELLWLDKNENGDPAMPALAKRILSEIDPAILSTYPECTPLYRKLAAHVGVQPENLLLAAGSDGVIRAVFEAFVGTGDLVLHTTPTFAMYPVYSRMYGARTITLEYQPSDAGPSLPADRFVEAIREARPRVVCLPNPDSPTGTVFDPDALGRIVSAAGDAGALMLIDEAYYPFYEWTALPWIASQPHVVLARTFAKAWGVAGLRIGYAIASPPIAKALHKVRPMYEVNTVAVAVMERMLDHADELAASVRRLNEGRDGFRGAMNDLGFRTLYARGNFLHVAFGEQAPAIHAALADLVLYRKDHNEACLTGFTRFSATTPERFRPLIARIRQVVEASR